jgi:parallel beta-helix repeat protein
MGSDNNTILENSITDNFLGLNLTDSENNTVSGNYIANNTYGIALENMYNNINENIVTNNSDIGIFLNGAEYNNIIGNNITINGRGIFIAISSNNVIHYNNFVNNTNHVETYDSNNIWDNDIEGNYWSNYDGIGAYVIDVNNQDNFPTKKPFRIPHQLNAQEDFTLSNIFWSVIIMAVVGIFLLVHFRRPRNI